MLAALMGSLLLGLAAAIGAGVLFNLSVALQALDARELPADEGLKLTLLPRLLRRKRWIAASLVGLLGWPLQIVALQLAPISVVQPALVLGLIVLLVAGVRVLGERVGRSEILGVAAIAIGVAGATVAAPDVSEGQASTTVILITFGALAVAAAAPWWIRLVAAPSPLVIVLAAGVGYGFTGLSTKFLGNAFDDRVWLIVLAWLVATGVMAVLAETAAMTALQQRPATYVAPITFVLEMLVPICLAPIVTDERLHDLPLYGLPVVAAVLVVVAGTVVLARSPAVGAVVGAGEGGGGKGTPPQTREAAAPAVP